MALKTETDSFSTVDIPLRYEHDEDNASPNDALLPSIDRVQQSKHTTDPPACNTALVSHWRLVILVSLALAATTGLFVWKSDLFNKPEGQQSAAQHPQSSQFDIPPSSPSDSLNLSSTSLSFEDQQQLSPEEVAVQTWLASNPHSQGIVPFDSAAFSPLLPTHPLEPTVSVKGWSRSCSDQWIAQGVVCDSMRDSWNSQGQPSSPVRLDVVWTWTNGSETERITPWREFVSDLVGRSRRLVKRQRTLPPLPPVKMLAKGADMKQHFRDHDELRHSIRSILAAFSPSSLRALHLVVGDAPACRPDDKSCLKQHPTSLQAQVPHWLDLSKIQFATRRPSLDEQDKKRQTRLVVHPHSTIFKTRPQALSWGQSGETLSPSDTKIRTEQWRSTVVPSFNSLAIESQIVNIDDVADTILNLNDDFFIMRELSVSDVSSPLTGPVFRLQRDLSVTGVAPGQEHDDPDGEWRGLGYTNWLLDQRFGRRQRPYVVHEGKSVSVPVLRELQETFLKELTTTAGDRFRGKGPAEVQSSFILVHYTIEKHREALLWSYFFGRSDDDQDGQFSPAERGALLTDLGYDGESKEITVGYPHRDTLNGFEKQFDFLGLERPKETKLSFTSADGFAHFLPTGGDARSTPWPSFTSKITPSTTACTIQLSECFGDEFTSSSLTSSTRVVDAFRRVAFEHPTCGDCLIVQLLNRAPKGLDAFLPSESPSSSSNSGSSPSSSTNVEAIGLTQTFADANFTLPVLPPQLTIRDRCIALIQRYSYVLGDSPSKFIGVRSQWALSSTFRSMDLGNTMPAFLAVNDDLPASAREVALKGVNAVFKEWYDSHLPFKSRWEL
ncbi:hypothetical protein T439DRAFT_309018 [Meredithblackwellia eburnea MCA 4105]